MPFSDQLALVNAAVQATLTDPAIFRPGSGDDIAVDVQITRPEDPDVIDRMNVVSSHPIAEFLVAQVACPKGGSILCPVDVASDGTRTVNACTRVYAIQGQPTAPGDGTWWLAKLSAGVALS